MIVSDSLSLHQHSTHGTRLWVSELVSFLRTTFKLSISLLNKVYPMPLLINIFLITTKNDYY